MTFVQFFANIFLCFLIILFMMISLVSFAKAFVAFAWWATACICALTIVVSIAGFVIINYGKENFWPQKAMKITVMGSSKRWFHVILLLANICCALWLIGCHGWTWWIIALPIVTFPLSGIILTWLSRFMCVLTWLVAKSIEMYVRIFRKNWF